MLHVSQLKKAIPPHATISSDSDIHLLTTFYSLPSEQVLARRLQLVGYRVMPMALLQRQSTPAHWASWELDTPTHLNKQKKRSKRQLLRLPQCEDALQLKKGGV